MSDEKPKLTYGDIGAKLALHAFASIPDMIEVPNPRRRFWQWWKPKTVMVHKYSLAVGTPKAVKFRGRS